MNDQALDLESLLRCPVSGSKLIRQDDFYVSEEGHRYPIVQGVPVLLAPRENETLWVRSASINAAKENPNDTFHVETLGLSKEQHAQLKQRLANHEKEPESIDPVISFMVGATSGNLYQEQVGSLKTLPIPVLRLPQGQGKSLLDIGCNWGRWSMAAAKAGYQVVGIDPQLGAVLTAKRLAKKLGLNAQFIVADATQLPFAPDSFDTVFSYSVLQHFSKENAAEAIRNAASISKANGRLFVQMPNRFGIRSLYNQYRRQFRPPEGFDVRYYSPFELKHMFEMNFGKSKLSVDGFFGLGIQPSDRPLLPFAKQQVVTASEALRAVTKIVPPLVYAADSIYVDARKS